MINIFQFQILVFPLFGLSILLGVLIVLLEHAGECYYCQRPVVETWRSYSSIICHGIIYFSLRAPYDA